MREAYAASVEAALRELTTQRTARHTIHEVLYDLHRILRYASAALILKDAATETLVIANRFNVTEAFARRFSGTIGRERVGALYYEEGFQVHRKGEDPAAYEEFKLEQDYETAIGVRVAIHDRTLGYLALYFDRRLEVSDEDRSFLLALGHVCALALHSEELEQAVSELRRTDPETGVLTYHCFRENLKDAFLRDRRYEEGLTLMLCDLDNFNAVAELYGLDTANALYEGVADELAGALREVDLVARYGKDELILLLPHTDAAHARGLPERLQADVHARTFTPHQIRTTLSVGVTSRREGDTISGLLQRVQIAMHQARVAGKGRLVVL